METGEETCEHKNFSHEIKLKYVRVKEVDLDELVVILKVTCTDCGEEYTFKGDSGFSSDRPGTGPGGSYLIAPVKMPPKGKKKLPAKRQPGPAN